MKSSLSPLVLYGVTDLFLIKMFLTGNIRLAMLTQVGFAVRSLFSMDYRSENIAEQRGIV